MPPRLCQTLETMTARSLLERAVTAASRSEVQDTRADKRTTEAGYWQ